MYVHCAHLYVAYIWYQLGSRHLLLSFVFFSLSLSVSGDNMCQFDLGVRRYFALKRLTFAMSVVQGRGKEIINAIIGIS